MPTEVAHLSFVFLFVWSAVNQWQCEIVMGGLQPVARKWISTISLEHLSALALLANKLCVIAHHRWRYWVRCRAMKARNIFKADVIDTNIYIVLKVPYNESCSCDIDLWPWRLRSLALTLKASKHDKKTVQRCPFLRLSGGLSSVNKEIKLGSPYVIFVLSLLTIKE